MAANAERAEARILDHCTRFGRWLDDDEVHTSASRRLGVTLDHHTLDMLQHGLEAHPFRFRERLSTY
jgi:hypothetical protein